MSPPSLWAIQLSCGRARFHEDPRPSQTALVVIDPRNAFMDDAVGHVAGPMTRDIVPGVNRPVMFRRLFRRQGWTEVRAPLTDRRKRESANLGRTTIAARLATPLRQHTRGAALFQSAWQAEDLPPPQAEQPVPGRRR